MNLPRVALPVSEDSKQKVRLIDRQSVHYVTLVGQTGNSQINGEAFLTTKLQGDFPPPQLPIPKVENRASSFKFVLLRTRKRDEETALCVPKTSGSVPSYFDRGPKPGQSNWDNWSISPSSPLTKLKITQAFKLHLLTTLQRGEGTTLCMPKKSEGFQVFLTGLQAHYDITEVRNTYNTFHFCVLKCQLLFEKDSKDFKTRRGAECKRFVRDKVKLHWSLVSFLLRLGTVSLTITGFQLIISCFHSFSTPDKGSYSYPMGHIVVVVKVFFLVSMLCTYYKSNFVFTLFQSEDYC